MFWRGIGLEAWQVMPPIGAVEPLAWIDCSGEEAAGSRAVRYETDTQLFERWKYSRLWFPPPHGILTLHRSHREYRMCAANCPRTRFRQSPVFHFTLTDQRLHGFRHILDRHIRIGAMLIEKIDVVRFQTL